MAPGGAEPSDGVRLRPAAVGIRRLRPPAIGVRRRRAAAAEATLNGPSDVAVAGDAAAVPGQAVLHGSNGFVSPVEQTAEMAAVRPASGTIVDDPAPERTDATRVPEQAAAPAAEVLPGTGDAAAPPPVPVVPQQGSREAGQPPAPAADHSREAPRPEAPTAAPAAAESMNGSTATKPVDAAAEPDAPVAEPGGAAAEPVEAAAAEPVEATAAEPSGGAVAPSEHGAVGEPAATPVEATAAKPVESIPAEPSGSAAAPSEDRTVAEPVGAGAEPVKATAAEQSGTDAAPSEDHAAVEPAEAPTAEPVTSTAPQAVDAAGTEQSESASDSSAAEPVDGAATKKAGPVEDAPVESPNGAATEPVEGRTAEPSGSTATTSVNGAAAKPVEATAAKPVEATAAKPVGRTDAKGDATVELPLVPAAPRRSGPKSPDRAAARAESDLAEDRTVELPVVPPPSKRWATAPKTPILGRPATDAPAAEADPAEAPAGPRSGLPAWPVVFGVVAVAVVLAHLATALLLAVYRVATQGEAALAVASLAARGTAVSPGPLALWDRFGALQIAVVELLLPAADPVDLARWAGLALGAVTTLLVWPVLRNGLQLSVTAVAVAVTVLGLALPLLSLRAGVTAAAPAALWLTVAALLAVGNRQWSALIAALVAVASAPLAAAALLGCAAHLVFTRSMRAPAPRVTGTVLGVVAVGIAALASSPGPLAGTGPDVPIGLAVAGAAVALVLVLLAARSARWLRPVLAGAVILVAASVVPGPSGATAALLAAPVLAAAVAVVYEYVRPRRALRVVALAAVVLLLAGPPAVAAAVADRRPAAGGSLAQWAASQTGSTTVIAADPLDRAALLAAGVPAARVRDLADPPVAGELRLVSVRPGGTATPCPPGLVIASTPRGSGGAPGAVCLTGTAAPDDASARARFGSALATNRALTLGPAAAAALRDGDADPRLLLTLAALTGAHRVGIADLPAVPLDAPGTPRHQAVLTSFDGGPAAQSELLRNWLGAQQAPFAPSVSTSGANLLITYPVPAPTGLLPS